MALSRLCDVLCRARLKRGRICRPEVVETCTRGLLDGSNVHVHVSTYPRVWKLGNCPHRVQVYANVEVNYYSKQGQAGIDIRVFCTSMSGFNTNSIISSTYLTLVGIPVT